ncbi:hypothetical protein [Rheinheimera nanhaiensis]|uniref:Uncharacterized protein n=1 Tax=Rheinheimera nanhaiensis E407-8 TaxID=562729 RepID=I1DXD9_9GAMM|nr:hypothetical protein [Rheinheimera nanhaiensis]GAB58717.1 hypothetical protein RNAN_1704 [Rheinheimera nanhaiensis E407-8]
MYIPKWMLSIFIMLFLLLLSWTCSLVMQRNPLPFPDPGSRIFSTPSVEAKAAVVDLLTQHGITERFQANSDGVLRSIMWDGTIINQPTPEVLQKVGNASASIGLVVADPVQSANNAANFLRQRGFQAEVVLDVEPSLPIAFVVTNALNGTVLNFRKHIIHLPKPDSLEH